MSIESTDFLLDTLVFHKVFASESNQIVKLADSSFLGGIKDYVHSIYDPNHPGASAVSFIVPGLLFKLGFPWLATIYEVAGALGVDWTGFWSSLSDKLKDFAESAKSEPKDESLTKSTIQSAVQEAATEHTSDSINKEKLEEMAEKKALGFNERLSNILFIKTAAKEIQSGNFKFIKTANVKSKILGFLLQAVSYVIFAAFVSLGFTIAGGAVSSLLGIKHEQHSNIKQVSDAEISNVILTPNPNINPEYTEYHPNDLSNIWMEDNVSVSNIESILINWAVDIYPQFKSNPDFLKNTSTFRKVVDMFKSRNKNNTFNKIVVPPPFTRILDIVNTFVGEAAIAESKEEHPNI